MRKSTQKLLSGAIDYAGIFPPSQLGLTEAFARYEAGRRGPEQEFLGRFVCSSTRLVDLAELIVTGNSQAVIEVVVASAGGSNKSEWEDCLERDCKAMNDFQVAVGDKGEIAAYEVRAGRGLDLERSVRDLDGFREAEVFVEIPLDEGVVDAVGILGESDWLGAKARLGGPTKESYPLADQVALFLRSCLDLEVGFKLTAGLHHPISHLDPASGAQMFGFLPVIGGACLALSEDLSVQETTKLISYPNLDGWNFDDSGIRWGELRAGINDIDQFRSLFTGFGSCSIDEPMLGLATLDV
jgi:hypothetical protein